MRRLEWIMFYVLLVAFSLLVWAVITRLLIEFVGWLYRLLTQT